MVKIAIFTIGEAARRLGVHPETVIRWEKSGLISPQRDFVGRRIFTQEDIEEIERMRLAWKRSPFQRLHPVH